MGNWLYLYEGSGKPGRLLSLVTGIIIAAGADHSLAGQSSSLGVGVSVIRSCRINTNDVISSVSVNDNALRNSQFIQCGGSLSPVVSVSSMPPAGQSSVSASDTLTVTLSY
jgi:hypothetical protein